MEPLKALTFLTAAGIVSLVGAGAIGFYAGYSAGRGNLSEIKAVIANAPVAIATGSGGAVSLKPVLEDIRALSKQVETLAAVKSRPAADAEPGTKPVLEEVRALARQVEALASVKARPAADTEQSAKPVLDEIKALARKVDGLKAAPASSSPEHKVAVVPDYTDALHEITEQVHSVNAKLDKQEPKAPKALIDEIRLLSASIQTLEPNTRRAIAEEVHSSLAALQNTEPKAPRALMDEIRTISANVRSQDTRPQAAISDQIKVLAASIDALKSRLSEDGARRSGDGGVSAELAQLHQLVAAASDQFGKCQTQLASFAGSGASLAAQPATTAASAVAVSQSAHREPSAVVFYDNVMLRKDQEKQYDEIGVRLALQSVGPRQVRLAVNRQGFGLSFGERKVFRSQDVECELNLMETNLNDSQARVSISCKR